jgi:hypothetical protein
MTMLGPDGALDTVGSSVRRGERRPGRAFTPLLIGVLVFLFLLQGCAAPVRLAAVPEDQEAAVETVSGMTNVRYWEAAVPSMAWTSRVRPEAFCCRQPRP